MAEISGIFAMSHTPVMTNMPDAPDTQVSQDVFAALRALGDELAALRPDALLVISNDHLHNFFLNNLPAFCLGLADGYDSPMEGWLKIERRKVGGHQPLAMHLLADLLDHGFDPAFSMELTLDHGMVTPLALAGLHGLFPIVPLFVNCVQPPLPRMMRCIDLGRAVGKALSGWQGAERVAVIATGGLSHDVGTPRMGIVNEQFDREFLRLIENGDPQALATFCESDVNTAGNGAEEVRNWLIAHGIAQCRPFRTQHYHPVHDWYTGIALGRWQS